MNYVLDTCAWLDALIAPELLSDAARDVMQNSELVGLSPVSLVELARKEAAGRISLRMPCHDWLERIALPTQKIRLLPLTPDIAIDATRLPGDFVDRRGKLHKDPSDQIITATARIHSCTLLTSDHVMLSYPHVKTLNSRK